VTEKTVELFFDLSSPYSYLAATQLSALARRAGAALVWRPMVLGAVFKASGNVMPAASAAKARWMIDDLGRWAAEYGVPFRMTSRFPVNGLKAMRLIVIAEDEGLAEAASLAAFRALWADDRDITADAELRAIAAEVGMDPDRAMARLTEQAVKDRLRAYTDEAIRRGVFGAPAIFVGDRLFWGNDRLHQVEAALAAVA